MRNIEVHIECAMNIVHVSSIGTHKSILNRKISVRKRPIGKSAMAIMVVDFLTKYGRKNYTFILLVIITIITISIVFFEYLI